MRSLCVPWAFVMLAGCGRGSPPPVPETAPAPTKAPTEAPARPPAPAPSRCDGVTAAEGVPFALVLDEPEALTLRATLCNVSGEEQPLPNSYRSHWIRLELTHASLGPEEPYDGWSRRSGSGVTPCDTIGAVPAGESVLLEQAAVTAVGDHHELSFGPLVWSELPPGTYRAQAKLRAHIDRCEPDGRRRDLWVGRLRSGEITIEVPE